MTSVTAADLEMILTAYDAIAERDLETMLALATPDGVLETRVETYRGIDGMRDYYEQGFVSGFTSKLESLMVLDDRVAGLSTVSLDSPTGLTAEDKVLELWEVEDARATYLKVMGRREGLEQLGLIERESRLNDLIAGYDAYNSGDYDRAVAMLAPDVEFERGELTTEGGTIEGADNVRRFFEPDAFETQRMEIHELVDADSRVLVGASFHARGAGSGIELSAPSYQVWERRGGKATRANFFQTRAGALAFLLDPPG